MAATKSRTSIYSAQTLTAGAGNTTSSWIDIDTAYGAILNVVLTNGATGPTVAAQVQIQVANDTAHTLIVAYGLPLPGSTTNNDIVPYSVILPKEIVAFRLVSGSNTGQNVTLDADYSKVTGI